jgi:regulator of cell morphogenesis and NO signaling
MNYSEKNTIGEIVAMNYKSAHVFSKHHIDFCCQGNRLLKDVLTSENKAQIIQELAEITHETNKNQIDFLSWPLDLLIDYIVKKHHRFVEEKSKEITPLLQKIVSVHGKSNPELLRIYELFSQAVVDLAAHMKKEELILFPYIQKMLSKKEATHEFVINPIESMHHEHNHEGERFREIAQLTNDYTPPNDACNTYKLTYRLLAEFEKDLHLHIHLENNILFIKAIELEQRLLLDSGKQSVY